MRVLFCVTALLATVAAPARADIVCDWIEVAGLAPDGRPIPPPLQDQVARTAPALVALAMFEIANSVDHRYRSYAGIALARGIIDAETAVAAGAHAVLVRLRPEQKASLDQALALSLATKADDEVRRASIAWGVEVAGRIHRDLFDGPALPPYRPNDVIGSFAPPSLPAITDWSLRAHPFFLRSIDEVMPEPPPALTSEVYARAFEETRRLGGVGQPGATPLGKTRATFLAGFNLDGMVRTIVDAKPRLVDRARLWARLRMAQHDANAMTSVAKMRYLTWRPLNAIRNADRDGNDATERDPNWIPVLPTPNHPEYPCGHCVASALVATLLAPETRGPVWVASDSMPIGVRMSFPDWPSFLDAASRARIEGGMHFRFSNEAGQRLGQRIGAIALERFAPPEAGSARD